LRLIGVEALKPQGYFILINMGKDTYYFSHDYNARNDEKIKELIFKHGMAGYGIYWSIIEELYQNTNVLHLNYERITYELRCEYETVKSVINDFGLFVLTDNNFSSLSVQKRLDERSNKSEKARLSVNKRWSDTNVIRTQYDSNTIKESKVKANKVIYIPTVDEVELYFLEKGYTKECAIKAFNYYSENNWKDSRNNQVKNWKQKMQGVWFKEENKIKNEQLPAHLTRVLN
jgi:hypothetical protein